MVAHTLSATLPLSVLALLASVISWGVWCLSVISQGFINVIVRVDGHLLTCLPALTFALLVVAARYKKPVGQGRERQNCDSLVWGSLGVFSLCCFPPEPRSAPLPAQWQEAAPTHPPPLWGGPCLPGNGTQREWCSFPAAVWDF